MSTIIEHAEQLNYVFHVVFHEFGQGIIRHAVAMEEEADLGAPCRFALRCEFATG